MKDIRKYIGKELLFFDGGMGTMMQKAGLAGGENPESWVITHPDIIKDIYRRYLEAGSNVLTTCTFGANPIKQKEIDGKYSTAELVHAAIDIAKQAIKETDTKGRPAFAALDTGSVGKLLEPLGTLSFEDTVDAFKELFSAGENADAIIIETMSDLYEMKAAVVAAKEVSDLPIFATFVLDESGRLLTGGNTDTIVALLEGLGVDALGINCGFGPEQMLPFVRELTEKSSIPVLVNPNAGLPRNVDGETVYDLSPEEFASHMEAIAQCGPWLLGGCCGTTPEHIKAMTDRLKDFVPAPVKRKDHTVICSYNNAVEIGRPSTIIGEKINPTGNKPVASALREGDFGSIIDLALKEKKAGAQVLDVNVGLPDIDEEKVLPLTVGKVQSRVNLPLVLDCSNAAALEKAARVYNGKPLINSVNGKQSSMDAVFPIVKKYGAAVIALALDDDGIPKTPEGRLKVAEKIIKEAEKYGIDRKNIIVDTLAMTISSDNSSAVTCLKSLELIREKLGVHTVLGVSNVSFGLPFREKVNSSFYAMALERGLSAAIINPFSDAMITTCIASRALTMQDENCTGYLQFFSDYEAPAAEGPKRPSAKKKPKQGSWAAKVTGEKDASEKSSPSQAAGAKNQKNTGERKESPLISAIENGMKEQAAKAVEQMLADMEPLDIINEHIVPALDYVGRDFGSGAIFLPQLLMSAEAASEGFSIIKDKLPKGSGDGNGSVILATVEGDIHDIGKNITKVLLESHDFKVIDLGKDVPAEDIVKAAKDSGIRLVGLSALMTTTVPNMEKTIKLLNSDIPDCKVCVGGAVLTKDYAEEIGADRYCDDAMATVNYAKEFYKIS